MFNDADRSAWVPLQDRASQASPTPHDASQAVQPGSSIGISACSSLSTWYECLLHNLIVNLIVMRVLPVPALLLGLLHTMNGILL